MIREIAYPWAFGYFEAKVYLPAASPGSSSVANWPAFWLNGMNWPTDGEIDIEENQWNGMTNTFHNAANAVDGYSQVVSGNYTGWHVYGALWTPNSIQWYIDGVLVHTVTNPPVAVTSAPMQILFVNSTGPNGGPLLTPATMLIDYVHVYQSTQYDPNAVAVTPQVGYQGPGDAVGSGCGN